MKLTQQLRSPVASHNDNSNAGIWKRAFLATAASIAAFCNSTAARAEPPRWEIPAQTELPTAATPTGAIEKFDLAPKLHAIPQAPASPWNMGFSLYTNEAGSSISGDIGYKDSVGLSLGEITFMQQPHPFLNAFANPHGKIAQWKWGEGNVLTLDGGYHGNVALTAFPSINSTAYTAHGGDFRARYRLGDFQFTWVSMAQGGVSFPTYDDIYLKWFNGFSTSIRNVDMYAIIDNRFAAAKTAGTSWALDYRPRLQGVKLGIDWRYDPAYTVFSVMADFDVIQPYAAFSTTHYLHRGKEANVRVSATAGVSSWNSDFFTHPSFFTMAYIGVDMGHTPISMRYSVQYENRNLGTTPEFTTGQTATPYDSSAPHQISAAADAIASSNSFSELVSKYKGKSKGEVLDAANVIGGVLGDAGYATGVFGKMNEMKFFDPSIDQMAHRNYDDIQGYLKRYADYLKAHGNYDGMPQDLKDGVAICAGIHEFMAEFLRQNGIRAYAISVNTPKTAHVVTLAFDSGDAIILDYDKRYTAHSGSLDEALRIYAEARGVPIFQSQIFGPGGKLIGTYETPAGRLLHGTFKVDPNNRMQNLLRNW